MDTRDTSCSNTPPVMTTQKEVLEAVKKYPGKTPVEIAEILGEPFTSNIYQIVEGLRRKKEIKRKIGKSRNKNHRVWLIYPR